MRSLVLIPWAETSWSAAGRLAGRTPLPLTNQGRTTVRAWAEAMIGLGLTAIYCGDEQTSAEIARIVALRLGGSWKAVTDLAEVDIGLWDGLTTDALKHRYAKAYKQWCTDPSRVCPPAGEDIVDAHERLVHALGGVLRKPNGHGVGIVLGPLAFGLVRCRLESVEPSRAHAMTEGEPLRYESTDGDRWAPAGPVVYTDAAKGAPRSSG